jgi:hypothetical protein
VDKAQSAKLALMEGHVQCKHCDAVFEIVGSSTTFKCVVCTSLNCMSCCAVHYPESCDTFLALKNLQHAIEIVRAGSTSKAAIDRLQELYYSASAAGVDECHVAMKEAELTLARFPSRSAHYLDSASSLAAAATRDAFWEEVFGVKQKMTCQFVVDLIMCGGSAAPLGIAGLNFSHMQMPAMRMLPGFELRAEMIISPTLLKNFIRFRQSLFQSADADNKPRSEIAYHGCQHLANLASIRMHGLVVPGHSTNC